MRWGGELERTGLSWVLGPKTCFCESLCLSVSLCLPLKIKAQSLGDSRDSGPFPFPSVSVMLGAGDECGILLVHGTTDPQLGLPWALPGCQHLPLRHRASVVPLRIESCLRVS